MTKTMTEQPSVERAKQELRVSEEFLARYNRPGPRYTSYPTAPVWNDAFGAAELRNVHAAADRARTPVSLYMHLPFCESLCLFCACNVIIQKDKRVAIPYFNVLKKEIAHIALSVSRERQVVQFHWGGGTPTYSSPAQLEDLFAYTKERFTFSPEAEIGIEVDPRVTSRTHLETLRRLGFNRLSMGIQDFHEPVQQAVHRIQSYEITRDLVLEGVYVGNRGVWWPAYNMVNINALTPQILAANHIDLSSPTDQALLTSTITSAIIGRICACEKFLRSRRLVSLGLALS